MTAFVPRRFVVAPSGFKESLSAEQAADAIVAGVRRVVPGAVVHYLPLVDGGEGSAATLARATGGHLVPLRVTGPVGDPVDSHIAVLGGSGPRTVVVEMAAAAGLRLVPRGLRDPGATTSYGVGELISAALDAGADRILVGCGDSGTCDGGVGALQALGARVQTALGEPVGRGGSALLEVASVDLDGLDPRLRDVEVLVAVNPHNVLCGERGVARVFGPQKGANPEQVEVLSTAMERWAKVLEHDLGLDLRTAAGSGASGGLGAGLAAGLDARLLPRFEVMLDHVDLDAALTSADLVLTAEGAIDEQTPRGKVPAEVARRAKRHGKPVIALAGTIGGQARVNYDAGIDAFAAILPEPISLEAAMRRGAEFLTDATERVLRLVLVGTAIAA
ncbi:MAG: glycerate kinase [Actinomycetota bacterium]|nr:glycerate kinase [Actinomycetota bacterium]